jgi:pSer/pThr/pTyr-binding forkhead associated (FHA) protein
LHIDDKARIPPGSEWKGRLVLTSPDQIVKFNQDGIIPLRLFAPEGRHAARPSQPSFKTKRRTVRINFWFIIGACLLIVVMRAVRQHGARIIRRINPIQLRGWLLVTDCPAGVEADDIDLERLGREMRDSSFVIGRSERADIRLPHTSVDKRHARIYGVKRGSRTKMHIKSIGISKVDVNFSRIYQSAVELGDRDVIEIGVFQFLYSVSHLQQVVVHFKDGSASHGVLQTWDMEGDSFSLLHRDKAGNETATHIDFSELKGIFFIQEYDEKIAKKIRRRAKSGQKDHIVVEFLDGERLEGHTIGRYVPETPRFLIAPLSKKKEDQNILYVLVERSFTKSVSLVTK